MSSTRLARECGSGMMNRVDDLVRLDLVGNPYGPCPAALEAVDIDPETPIEPLMARLRRRLSDVYHVPVGSIRFLDSADRGLNRIVESHMGPIIGFSPSSCARRSGQRHPARDTVWIARGPGCDGALGPDPVSDIPADAVAVIDSPSDPLGAILSPAEAVRVSRACRLAIIDERFAEFAGLTLLPLATEFDNVILLRSFEAWAGIQDSAGAWAVASPRTAAAVGLEESTPAPGTVAAALATLDNLDSVSVILRLVREERSRLYRLLRKLSFLEPLPSWGPFLLARVNIVAREQVLTGLMERGIHVHAPIDPGLERFVRFGIGSRWAMDRLRSALLELGPQLIG